MAKVEIYGASDDLIEVDGDLNEEFDGGGDIQYLAFSDGTLLSVEYDSDVMWRINRLVEGVATYSKKEATDPDEDYTDRVTLESASLKWVVCGSGLARATEKKAAAAATGR
jgi:hypothetical protein